jgi:hypothetical protein
MCTKTQGCGHVCTKLCKQECSPCPTMVEKKIRACGHFVHAPCYYEPSRTDCKENCSLKLKCGHTCKQNCSNVNCESKPCEEFVEPSLGLCGHLVDRRCFEKIQGLLIRIQFWHVLNWTKCWLGLPVDISKCTHPCNSQLLCGHFCSGTCSTCHQGRFHVPCRQKCGRLQICGHR